MGDRFLHPMNFHTLLFILQQEGTQGDLASGIMGPAALPPPIRTGTRRIRWVKPNVKSRRPKKVSAPHHGSEGIALGTNEPRKKMSFFWGQTTGDDRMYQCAKQRFCLYCSSSEKSNITMGDETK